MDLTLIRTFMEVAQTGSFLAAADRLFVTQSAVSLRVQRLEQQIGKQLFERSKAGAVLTTAGKQFEPYALSILRAWNDARQQVAIPEGYTESFAIGGQASLWPRLGYRWLDALRAEMPELSLRAELGMPDRLTRALNDGLLQAVLTYEPTMRPGFVLEPVIEDDLVLVAPWKNPTMDQINGHYAYVDWGESFLRFHQDELGDVATNGMTFAIGVLVTGYLIRRGLAGYLPGRFAARYINEGRLHLVADAPHFTYPVWVVWRDDIDPHLLAVAQKTLSETADVISEEIEDVTDSI
ncbi:MAG: LysR family transcriptional regulator [Rhodobacteraceae bacterium]|nr:MAG: LysR family transcriptional regulator [Paracoccaceae bacterium]